MNTQFAGVNHLMKEYSVLWRFWYNSAIGNPADPFVRTLSFCEDRHHVPLYSCHG